MLGGQSELDTDYQGCRGQIALASKSRQCRPPIELYRTTPDHMPYNSFLAPLATVLAHARQRSTSCLMPVMMMTITTSSSNRRNKMKVRCTGSSTTALNEKQSDDTCQVCLVAARTGVALIPCRYSRFCTSCAETVALALAGSNGQRLSHMPFSNPDGSACIQLVVTLPTILTLRCFAQIHRLHTLCIWNGIV